MGIEARGFILAAPVAERLGAGFVPVRKPGKLPWRTERVTYELEYGTDALEVHLDAVLPGQKVLIVDDVLATGGTAAATVALLERLGADIVGLSFLMELAFLPGRDRARRPPGARAALSTDLPYPPVMATVTRVLPWRRNAAPPAEEVASLVATYRSLHPKAPTSLITGAYEVAALAHRAQVRKSGEAYIHHPLAVAKIVAELGLDDVTDRGGAAARRGRGHRGQPRRRRGREFGADVAAIVDGVTKLERIQFDSKEAQQAATMRKMLVAMANDVRVLIIKLSDRLHNMLTLAAMPEWKQMRIAHETIDIYAPLAHRLGMQEMKTQLEDLAFAAMHPKRFAEIDHMVSTRTPERELYLAQVLEQVRLRLAELRIEADVTGRPKHLWSIYEKMVVKGKEFDDIFDLVGIRVTVESVKDCYAALGSIHATWKPVQGRFKDYIAMPKFNLYQSLHTTVVGPQGKTVEVQIRTREMHQRAEFGVAAHYAYKGDDGPADMPWLNRIIDWQLETSDPSAFMETLKVDLEQDEVYVFTPKGKVVTLPVGATPIDFAYTIHTEVGHACIGARVNGRLVPLDTHLTSGDTIEIFTSKVEGAGPVTRLAEDRGDAARGQQDPPVVLARAPRGRHRERPRRAGQGHAPRGPPGAEGRRRTTRCTRSRPT